MLPERVVLELAPSDENPVAAAAQADFIPSILSRMGSDKRRIPERADEEDDDGPVEAYDDEAYSVDDEAFEPYEEDQDTIERSATLRLESQDDHSRDTSSLSHAENPEPDDSDDSSEHQGSDSEDDDGYSASEHEKPPAVMYDERTYSLITQLRAANKNLTSEVRRLKKQLESAQSQNKALEHSVRTLTMDLTMHKQTIRAFQTGKRDDDAAIPRRHLLMHRRPRTTPTLPVFVDPYDDRAHYGSSRKINSPWAPVPVDRSSSLPSPSQRSPARRHVRTSSEEASSPRQHEEIVIKLRKLERERHDTQARNAHQLANYSHELSRLERQLEQAHRQVQERDNRLRLRKVRNLYASLSVSQTIPHQDPPTATSGNQTQMPTKSVLSDDLWTDLLPSHGYDRLGHRVNTTFSSHIGAAFEQLLSHQLTSFHDHALDRSTRDWLREVRACGTQMLQLHNSFQSMGRTLQRLAECSNVYRLAEIFASECCKLLQAEQSLVFIVDPAEQEFWCRIPRVTDGKEMNTVRSKLMPFATPCPTAPRRSSSDASATGDSHNNTRSGLPCGLASMVYHTKRPLLLLAGHIMKHPCYSSAMDNTDRFIAHTSVSTLLMPILHHGEVQGVVQLCGKTTQIEALGLSIALEKCDSFTCEDQSILTMLSHFVSGILPKVTYFTEVESNKLNEETLLQLAPEIFTCLRFEDLGKIIIQNAKDILDADRCSLFVADNTDRTLHNWQSDINGTGVEVHSDARKTGMTIPFGYGIVGLVAETWQPINIVDAYEDPRFNSSWDQKTKYRTKSMLTVPILTTSVRKHKRRRSISTGAGQQQQQQHPASEATDSGEPLIKQSLLGVVQVINKSGGAPFRAKDEFLLQTISKLIALAIENSQLFQKNQELCRNVGKLISGGDMVEAMISLSASVEELLGVERAAVYVFDTHTQDMVTFHPKRRHKIMVKEAVYRHALFGEAVVQKELVIVNDLTTVSNFNAYVDSIAGCVARNLLFAPLLVDDDSESGSGPKLLGMIHLVNTKGRKINFDRHDLFLSIVTSLCASVLSSIIEKQMMLRQKEQSTQLLDTSMSFFKEMSPIGIINAVYNACTSIFNVEKAHLFLWEGDRRHMWTSKLSPTAEANAAYAAAISSNVSSSLVLTPMGSANGQATSLTTATMNLIPSLGSQTRRISVLTDQTLRVPTTEGLLEQVLVKGVTIIIRQWITASDSSNVSEEASSTDQVERRVHLLTPLNSVRSGQNKYTSQASASDERNGFIKHSVVACPVWDNYGLDIIGVLVLLFQKGRAPLDGELANLPILSRQISGALNVCGDLSGVSSRCKQLQSQLELSMRRPDHVMSLTLSARGHLASYSEPLNGGTGVFSASAMVASVNTTTALNIGISTLLPMDDDGHRWVFQLSGVPLQQMKADHYIQWIGKDLPATASVLFDKMRTDIQSVYMRKESVTGVIDRRSAKGVEDKRDSVGDSGAASKSSLPWPLEVKIRRLLWDFVDDAWQINLERACALFDSVNGILDTTTKRADQATPYQPIHLVSTKNLERVLSGLSHNLQLTQVELESLHEQFADRATNLIDIERMLGTLAPQLKVVPFFRYEIVPVLDPIMHTVVNIHVLLTALT